MTTTRLTSGSIIALLWRFGLRSILVDGRHCLRASWFGRRLNGCARWSPTADPQRHSVFGSHREVVAGVAIRRGRLELPFHGFGGGGAQCVSAKAGAETATVPAAERHELGLAKGALDEALGPEAVRIRIGGGV